MYDRSEVARPALHSIPNPVNLVNPFKSDPVRVGGWPSLGVAILCLLSGALASIEAQTVRQVDDARARAAGIRKLTSRHLALYTDLPSDPEVDRLPAVFDQAVPQWAAYFGIDPAKTHSLRTQGYLIADHTKFEALGLMLRGLGHCRA